MGLSTPHFFRMTKFALFIVLGVTACLYAVLHMTFGITGLWWLVAVAFFPAVVFVAAMLTSLMFPALFEAVKDESEEIEDGEDTISTQKSVMIVDEGPSIGTFKGRPIHEYLDVRCFDGEVRRFEYQRVSLNEHFDQAPADRWIVVYDMLYTFNNPKQAVAQPESTVQ